MQSSVTTRVRLWIFTSIQKMRYLKKKRRLLLNLCLSRYDSSHCWASGSSAGLRFSLERARQVANGAFGIILQIPIGHSFYCRLQLFQTRFDIGCYPDRFAFGHLIISLDQILKSFFVSVPIKISVYFRIFFVDEFIVLGLSIFE